MTQRLSRLLATFTLALLPVAPLAQSAPPATGTARSAPQSDAMARGRSLVEAFYAVRLDSVWSAFTAPVRAQWGTLEQFRAFRQAGVREYGAELEVLDEEVVTRGAMRYYVRNATFERHPEQVWSVVMGFDAAGRVTAFSITFAGVVAPEPGGPRASLP